MKFQVNDRVKYSSAFLASIGGHEMARDRGTVLEVKVSPKRIGRTPPPRVRVRWDGVPEPETSLETNLSRA